MDKNIQLNLHRGKVISIEDPNKKGRVQVKLLPEMKDIEDTNAPWLEPFLGNSSTNELSLNPPEKDSIIWLLADDKFYHRYYLPFKYNLEGLVDYSTIETILGNIEGLDTEYNNLQFILYEDQSLSFHNRSDGSHGFIQSTGSYSYFDAEGSVTTYSVKSIKMENDSGYSELKDSGEFHVNDHLKVLV